MEILTGDALPNSERIGSVKEKLLARLERHGQSHLLAHWDQLSPATQQSFAEEIASLDLPLVEELFRNSEGGADLRAKVARAAPPPAVRLRPDGSREGDDEVAAQGLAALQAGEVGVLLVAGGQGTRLGFDLPKGMYPIGPLSEATLFQIHLEKVLAISRRYGQPVPLYVMTSPATHEATRAFLHEHDWFGLPSSDVQLFCQATLPAVDAQTGEILVSAPGHISLSPDGHGGMLSALEASGGLADAERRGLKQLFYFQVDNPLVPVADPILLGHHRNAHSELTTLAVAKQDPLERVGNLVTIDGQVQIIEYSDMPAEVAEQRDADCELLLWAGSIAVHIFDVAFLARMAAAKDSLPFHVAHKAVPYLDASGSRVEPKEPNAVKFERFIFDLLPRARMALVVEGRATEVFSPLKNAEGSATDTPQTVREDLMALHRRWLQEAGAQMDAGVAVEISPLYALDAKQLAERLDGDLHIGTPTYFRLESG